MGPWHHGILQCGSPFGFDQPLMPALLGFLCDAIVGWHLMPILIDIQRILISTWCYFSVDWHFMHVLVGIEYFLNFIVLAVGT